MSQKLAVLLWNRAVLKGAVRECFRATVGLRVTCAEGAASLDFDGLNRFIRLISRWIGLAERAFDGIGDDYIRFDFNGDNSLQEHECYRLVKHHLRKLVAALHGQDSLAEISVPYKSMWSEGYQIIREFGRGSQGSACLAMDAFGTQRCIKSVRKTINVAAHLDDLKDEVKILSNLHNNHIVRIFDIFQDAGHYHLVCEPYFGPDFGRLRDEATRQGVAMTEDWWQGVFRQCFEGLVYMHKHAVMHCDVKEPNLMLKTDDVRRPDVVFIDFGIAQEFVHPKYGKLRGTPGYLPPETWRQQKWFPKGDTFSMGVCMAQLVLDKVPFETPGEAVVGGLFCDGATSLEDIELCTQHRPAPLHLLLQPPSPMVRLAQLLGLLLEKNMRSRASAVQALEHPWFAAALAVGGNQSTASAAVAAS